VDFHVEHDVVISGDQRGLFIVHRLSTGEQLCTLLLIAQLSILILICLFDATQSRTASPGASSTAGT
jgi:hypothetical protein